MNRIGFIGLGVMGYPMAGHLCAAGHDVTVHNRTRATADRWVAEHGGRAAASPAEAAAGADLVSTIVGADDDVRAVVTGPDGALGAMAPGTVLVDHTTTSADLARELHQACGRAQVGFVDAPVSGGESGAQQGVLTVMCGGDENDVESLAAVAGAYAAAVTRMGPAGAGQLTKMVNQVCIAGIIQGLSEGIALAQASGLDVDQVVEVISRGAAGSWQMANRGSTMARGEFEFGFAVDWMRKDLGIARAEIRRVGGSAPVAALVDQFYARIQARGGQRWDTSSLIDLLNRP
ncbi:MAG: NAD(P)-dependent oxidoreductase [Acidimicrobiales bacterium]